MVDTLFDVWRKADQFRSESSVLTWTIGIARNHIRMKYRGRARREKPELMDDIELFDETLHDPSRAVIDEVIQRQNTSVLMSQLRTLPAEQAEAIHFVFFEGYTFAETATVLQVPEGTVKTRVFHARRKLKLLLEQQGVDSA